MVLSPPLCLPFSRLDINGNPTSNTWDVTLNITSPQGTGSGLYDGTTVNIGQWIGTGSYGYAFKINYIISQSSSSVRCIIEDVDNWNLKQDPSGGLDGGGPIDGNLGFIFELAPNGLPTLTEVVVFPNVTWTDSLYGRFISTSLSPTGGTGPTGPTGPTGQKGDTGPTGPVTTFIFDGGFPESNYSVGPAFDCGTVS